MRITGENSLDYMNFHCADCGGAVRIDFLGYDPAIPRFRFACQGCGEHGEFKMQWQLWGGLPRRPARQKPVK